MRQDLTDWLNGGSGTGETGLLLVPLDARRKYPDSANPGLLLAVDPEPVSSSPSAETTDEASPPQPEREIEAVAQADSSGTPAPLSADTPSITPPPHQDPSSDEELKEMSPPIDDEGGSQSEDAADAPSREVSSAPEVDDEEAPLPGEPPQPEPDVLENPQEPRPMFALWTQAVSAPEDWEAGLLSSEDDDEEMEESEGARNKSFTRRLHQGLQARKSHSMARRTQEPRAVRYWPRALAFCLLPLLALMGAWLALRYLQDNAPRYVNSSARGLAYPVAAEQGGEDTPPSPAVTILPQPAETPLPSALPGQEEGSLISREAAAAVPTEPPPQSPATPVLPLSYEGQIRLGTAALNYGRYDEALERFTQALERRKDDPRAWMGIVGAFEKLGAGGEAFRVLVDARNALPRNPTIEVKLRELQLREKRKGK
ncbi:MAG: hypothetical protein IJ702_02385 [Fretibacterium sp.]|nr:hypothetical protein [Fretibacterium sp.]